MVKKPASFVLASLGDSTYRFTRCTEQSNGYPVRLGSLLAAASLDGLFDHPLLS
jgi:hypothetical protein